MTISCDALDLIDRLVLVGYSQTQAKTLAFILAEIMPDKFERCSEQFITSAEFKQEVVLLHSEFNALRSEMKLLNAGIKLEITRWVGSIAILQMTLVVGLVIYLL